ncbi:MAG: fibronectin type III domain-containing protein [Candidatus Marinimicrobia bacterium]|nr:fibronectin type III domain-containing protein [Candidatus Neomarinimicrobiota bacterium]
MPIIFYKKSVIDTSYWVDNAEVGVRVRINNQVFQLFGKDVKTQRTYVNYEYTRHYMNIVSGNGIIFCKKSSGDYQSSTSDTYYLERWRIDGQYYGRPSSPEGVTTDFENDSLKISWILNPENNVSHYKISMFDENESLIDTFKTESAEQTTFFKENLINGKYIIKLQAVNFEKICGRYSKPSEIVIDNTSNSIQSEVINTVIKLNTIYPNPFNPVVNIEFELPISSEVTVKMYTVYGKLVDQITERNKEVGIYSYRWNASQLPSGI